MAGWLNAPVSFSFGGLTAVQRTTDLFGAALAGIEMFTRALALEGKGNGIRDNVLTPSIVGGTEFYDRLMTDPFAGRLFSKAAQKAELGMST